MSRSQEGRAEKDPWGSQVLTLLRPLRNQLISVTHFPYLLWHPSSPCHLTIK